MRNSKFMKKAVALFLTLSLGASVGPVVTKAAESDDVVNPSTQKNVTISGSENASGKLNNPLVKASVTTWDSVTFGSYWQEDTNQDGKADQKDAKQPIKWRVLSVNGDDMYLLSEKNLDAQQYSDKEDPDDPAMYINWESSFLNKWLNETFLQEAFSEDEQAAIIGATEKIQFLSEQELIDRKYELKSTKDLITEGTSYVKQLTADDNSEVSSSWWMMTKDEHNYATCVDSGCVAWKNITSKAGIRPVIHLKKSSGLWKNSEKIVLYKDFNSQWDCVYFGNYYQNDAKKKQPIKWRVLSVNGDDVFMIASRCLDFQSYSENAAPNTSIVAWEKSLLRSWLNTTFYKEAFNTTEQTAINNSSIANDKVSILSREEKNTISYGLLEGMASACPTEYAKDKGEMSILEIVNGYNYFFGSWLLRDSAIEDNNEILNPIVTPNGFYGLCDGVCGIRPVIHISLSSGGWTAAGKLTGLDNGSAEQYPESLIKDSNSTDEKQKPSSSNNEDTPKVKAPSKVKLTSAKNGKGKKLTVKWKKVTGAKGYQLQYALNKKFKKKKSVQTKKTKYTIKKLKKKKTYYIRVRAYKMNGKKKVYGKWSTVKKVKIKK